MMDDVWYVIYMCGVPVLDHGRWVSDVQLDAARRHAGTDQDIIICDRLSHGL